MHSIVVCCMVWQYFDTPSYYSTKLYYTNKLILYKAAIFCSVVCVASRQHAVKCSVQDRRVSALAHRSEIVHTDQDRCAWGLKTQRKEMNYCIPLVQQAFVAFDGVQSDNWLLWPHPLVETVDEVADSCSRRRKASFQIKAYTYYSTLSYCHMLASRETGSRQLSAPWFLLQTQHNKFYPTKRHDLNCLPIMISHVKARDIAYSCMLGRYFHHQAQQNLVQVSGLQYVLPIRSLLV